MPRELHFINEDINLMAEECMYWRRMFQANIKIGAELEACYARSTNTSTALNNMRSEFAPTDNPSIFGKCGVYDVKGDGSLDNGIELCTVGRRLNFLDLYEQYKYITTFMMQYNPYMHQRAGLHNHVLLDYGGSHSCLEKPVPGIILKNFLQLLRRHIPELIWITSTVKTDGNHITRYGKFCDHDTLIRYTPTARSVKDYCSFITGETRYKFINLRHLQANGDNITRFHFELRFPDGSFIPAQIAAVNMLFASMLLKAIELSEIGVLSAGKNEDWEETKTLANAMRNNGEESNRLSTPPTEEQLARVKERALEFVQFMKSSLMQFDKHTYMVVRSLADTPLSMMQRTSGIPEINEYFGSIIQSMYDSSRYEDVSDVSKVIIKQLVRNAASKDDWCVKTATLLSTTKDTVVNKLFKIGLDRQTEFDVETGLVYFR